MNRSDQISQILVYTKTMTSYDTPVFSINGLEYWQLCIAHLTELWFSLDGDVLAEGATGNPAAGCAVCDHGLHC